MGEYFLYRTIVSNSRAKNTEKQVKSLRKLGLLCLKLSTQIASKSVGEEKDQKVQAALMDQAQQNLQNMLDEEQRFSMLDSLVDTYVELSEEDRYPDNSREAFLERAISLKLEVKGDASKLQKKLACMLVDKCQKNKREMTKDDDPYSDTDVMIAHDYVEAAKLFLDIRDIKNFKKYVKIGMKTYNDVNFAKYDLPVFKDSKDIDSYIKNK